MEQINNMLFREIEQKLEDNTFNVEDVIIHYNKRLSKPFLIKYKKNTELWNRISKRQDIDEKFIEKYKAFVNLNIVFVFNNALWDSNYKNLLDWDEISKLQYLDEAFIEDYEDKVNWISIFQYQKLSNTFIDCYFSMKMDYNNLKKDDLLLIINNFVYNYF